MSKLGKRLIASVKETRANVRGKGRGSALRVHAPAEVDVRSIRKKLGVSQSEFATCFGISPGTLRDWEQRRKRPEGPARVLLKVIDKEPEAVRRALEQA
jgi:putative transcriptional regulator